MLRKYCRMSIGRQIAGFGVIFSVLLTACAVSIAFDVNRAQARSLSTAVFENVAINGHGKAGGTPNPLLARPLASDSSVHFRLAGIATHNVANSLNAFDTKAITYFRTHLNSVRFEEVSVVAPGGFEPSKEDKTEKPDTRRLLSAYPLVADKSCLGCHGARGAAHPSVLQQFPHALGFGYQEGQLVGVVSVSVPLSYDLVHLIGSWSVATWLLCLVMAAFLLLTVLYVRIYFLRSITAIRNFVQGVVYDVEEEERPDRVRLDEEERSSSNELHQLSFMSGSLANAVKLLRKSFSRGRSPHLTLVE